MTISMLDRIVHGLFDYSGMFPPEAKSFEGALHDAARFHQSLRRPFLVNTDIVLGWSSFLNVTSEILKQHGFAKDTPVAMAMLGAAKTTDALGSEAGIIQLFNNQERGAWSAVISSYELKITSELVTQASFLESLRLIEQAGVTVAIEPDLSGVDWEDQLAFITDFLSSTGCSIALKVRGTGPTGIGNEKIAAVLGVVADKELHFKATGGMHHPVIDLIRYQNEFGFLNLAIALLFRRGLGARFSVHDVKQLLNNQHHDAFQFGDELRWKEFSLSAEIIHQLKQKFRFSIGSCSLREPDEDLIRLFDQ